MALKSDAKFGGTDLLFQNWHEEFDEFWLRHSKVWKIFILMGSFRAKYILFELKNYRGVIFHGTEEWCKIWRGTDLLFQNWHEEFGKFWPKHWKVKKKLHFNEFLLSKVYILVELKKYRGVIFHDNEEWCKIWRKTNL